MDRLDSANVARVVARMDARFCRLKELPEKERRTLDGVGIGCAIVSA
jgi:hypothetical protein